jgi:hypothetical protein
LFEGVLGAELPSIHNVKNRGGLPLTPTHSPSDGEREKTFAVTYILVVAAWADAK